MRRLLMGVVAAWFLVFAAAGSAAQSATATVQIKSTGFFPASVSINQDDSVSWKNVDTKDHQVVSNTGAFASPILGPGKAFTFRFRSGGTFRYHDGLHPTLRGKVVVKGAPPVVTLAASAPIVKFGTPVTLTGIVSNKKSGETVTLVALPFGQTTKQVIATLQTGADGAFSFAVTPQIFTSYQAQWKSAESSVSVQVAPLIRLRPPSRSGWFHFFVKGARPFAGQTVFLQRFTRLGQWTSVRRLTLGSKSGRLLSLGSVRAVLPRGRWSIRIFMPADQVGPGYVQTQSGSQPIVRR
jgi:plastocyanin